MIADTKLSDKAQVVVPKATRDRLGWEPGTDLEVVELGGDVILRRRSSKKTLTADQAVALFKQIYQHKGSPVTIEEMDAEIADVVADRWATR